MDYIIYSRMAPTGDWTMSNRSNSKEDAIAYAKNCHKSWLEVGVKTEWAVQYNSTKGVEVWKCTTET